jgi:hypothetical protein
MLDINILYYFALFLLGGCIITVISTSCYIMKTTKYIKKEIQITQELEKNKINNETYKRDI